MKSNTHVFVGANGRPSGLVLAMTSAPIAEGMWKQKVLNLTAPARKKNWILITLADSFPYTLNTPERKFDHG
jgi:hypothetical protein